MAEISYDTLTIQINAESKVATKNINALNRGLKNLDQTAKDLDKEKIEEVKGLLLDIANIDFSNVSKGLQDIVSAFKSFQSKAFMKATSNGTNLSGAYPTRKMPTYEGTALPHFEAFEQGDLAGFNKFVDELKEASKLSNEIYGNFTGIVGIIESGLTPLERLGQELDKMGLNGKQTQAIFNSIAYETDRFSPKQLKAIEKLLVEVGYSGEKAKEIISRLKEEVDESGKKATKSGRSFAKMFINIMKYRVVRRMIQNIFQEITSAIGELASVDKDFDQSLGQIKSAIDFVARALTSVIAPVIKLIAPIITDLANGIGEIFNSFAGNLAGALGQDEFAEATENVETYTESLKKAQNTQMGFDKLNVISQNNGNFQMQQTEATTNLGKIMEKLRESIAPIITQLKVFIQKIKPLLVVVISLATRILDETMEGVNTSIASIIMALGSVVEFIGLLLQVLQPILSILITFANLGLNVINELIIVLGFLVHSILQPFMPILELLADGVQKIAPILQYISEALKGAFGMSDNVGVRVGAGILSGGASELLRWINSLITGKKYATGGFVEDGLFMANHNELIGSFSNGKNVVANNQQITQGIYQAVLQAMRESGGQGIVINLDGREIAKVVNKQNANSGSSFLKGGNINYGK